MPFVVAGIGATTDALDALQRFFENLPQQTGIAFVLVTSASDPEAAELSGRLQSVFEKTDIARDVITVKDTVALQPDYVYVSPDGGPLHLRTGQLQQGKNDSQFPIDHFFSALGDLYKEKAVGVLLSASGSDGARGLKVIKEAGGLVLVREPSEPEQGEREQPQSALKLVQGDLVASTAELARALVSYASLPTGRMLLKQGEEDEAQLQQLFQELRHYTGHDFSHYKRSTILRRLRRRMSANRVDDVASYLRILRDSREEARALANDYLISVTAFFRDREAFNSLRKSIRQRVNDKSDGETVRVWVPGCATGEEAYSLAILLSEAMRKQGKLLDFQIFGTDIDERALSIARRGFYPSNIAEELPDVYLEQYFIQQPGGYQVTQEIQKSVLFAHHNLLKDPPFSRLDLISCRNLLIYLQRNVQKHLFQIFHYSLKPSGYLFLGSSETLNCRPGTLFAPVDKEHRIYQRRAGTGELPRLPGTLPPRKTTTTPLPSRRKGEATADLGDLHRQWLLQRFTPPSVVVNRQNEIRHISGDMKRYLHPPQGQPTYNLLRLALEPLKLELRSLLFQVFRRGQMVRSAPLAKEQNGGNYVLRITAEPLPAEVEFDEELALIVFEESEVGNGSIASGSGAGGDETQQAIIEQLEEELQASRHRLQTVIEEYETSNEELKVSNEELQSTNEELFSTTEELQTREEELHSANRELQALNQDLQAKIDELNRANSDLENLIEGNSVATIFLDRDLNVMRFTPRATELFNLLPTDVGRPFAHVTHELDHDSIPGLAQRVLNRLELHEDEVQSSDGQWYQMRLLPYRTVDNRIDGVVLTFVDVTNRRLAEEAVQVRARQQTVVAELGHAALEGSKLEDLMDLAARQVAQALDVEMCKVLELLPGGEEFLLKAGVGWKEGYVGNLKLGTETNSQAGYALEVSGPVVVNDLTTERRFSGPTLLLEHGVVSGISVVIAGREQPYGVIGAHTTRRRNFTQQDVTFVVAVSNVLSTAVERRRAEEERNQLLARVEAERAHLHTLFMQAPASIAMHEGPDHVYTFVNEQHQRSQPDLEYIGKKPRELFPDYAEHELMKVFDQVYETGKPVVRREELLLFDADDDGELEDYYLDLVLQPIRRGDTIEGVMSFAFDVTSRVKAQQQLEAEQARLRELAESLEERVNERTTQVRALASALSLAEQRERERISQILHDDLQQLLHALHVQLLMLQTEPAHRDVPDLTEKLGELDTLIENALEVTRALTVELSPPILKGEGLNEAFYWLASHMAEIHNLDVSLNLQDSPELPSKDLRELIFQMVRELLFNVVKHGDVQEATLTVSRHEDEYLVEVADAGTGFDVEAALDQQEQGGFGLSSIQRRLQLFGGDMRIDSKKGSGTRVTIYLPSTLTGL